MKSFVRMFRSILIIAGTLVAGLSEDARACNVPAFRYALERWPADPYQVLVYHQAAPGGEAFELLQKGATERGGLANYSFTSVDVTKPESRALAEQRKITSYPWLEIRYPMHFQFRGPIWSGALTTEHVKALLDSPCRSVLSRKLLGGHVAVWVLLKSGHDSEDSRARQALQSNLERASAALRIPETGTDQNGDPVGVTEFKSYPVRFGLIEIARDDPQERMLVSALVNCEPDLAERDEPMAFPVFGRGRALYALVGNGIQEKTIMEACQSMLDWCSCEIKALSPGTDLLISADWSRPYGGRMVKTPELPPLTGLGAFRQSRKATPSPAVDPQPAPAVTTAVCRTPAPPGGAAPPSTESPVVRNLVYLAGAAGLVLVAVSVLVTVKARK